jgi:HAE1 family hydrophobic/amphiphilic exporter-1
MELMVTGDRPLREIYDLTDGRIKDALSRIAGVASADMSGGEEREIQVNLSREELKGYGLSITDVVQMVNAGNLSAPSGRIIQSEEEFSVRLEGKFTDLDELRNLSIFLPTGGKVKLGSLGTVEDTSAEKRMKVRYGGREGVALSIVKLSDSQPIELAENVRKTIAELETALPDDIDIKIVKDDSGIILDSVSDVQTNIIIGIILTSIFLFLFLHSLRMTIIVAIIMPTCIISSFLLMDASGFTLNIMSTLGLIGEHHPTSGCR